MVADVAASFQAAVVDVLVVKLLAAADERNRCSTLVIGGGVAANSALRGQGGRRRRRVRPVGVPAPAVELCTDNGAMIAATAWWRLRADGPTPLDAGADPNLRLGLTGGQLRHLVGTGLVPLALALGEC